MKRKRKDPPPVTGTADVLDTDAAPSTATAPPPTPEGTGPGLEARVEELDAIYFFIAHEYYCYFHIYVLQLTTMTVCCEYFYLLTDL